MSYNLSEISSYVTDKVLVSDLQEYQYISTDNMVVNRGGIVATKCFPTVSKVASFKKGDILISNIRPYFKKIWHATFDGGCSNDVLIIRAKEETDDKFLYYVLSSDDFFDYATATSKDGTKMPRGDKVAIMKYQVPDLVLEQQQKIAKILSALDEKIELNNKINENLHAQAQAIFKSWFVDFEPFGGTMPSDWKKGKLSDLIKVCYGKDHKKLKNGFIPVYGSGGIIRYADKYLYDKEAVLIPRKGTLNNVIYINEPFWTVDTMFYVEMKRKYLAKFIYYFVKRLNLEAMNVGSAVPSMTTAILNSLELFIPTEYILKKFDLVLMPLFNLIKNNNGQNIKLAQIRDTLLPKLLSGELDV